MKRKLINVLFIAVIAVMAFTVTSCSDDTPSFNETQWEVVNITVPSGDWVWNDIDGVDGFYSATYNLPEMSDFIFTDGAALGYYYFDSRSKTALPYVKSYYDNAAQLYYTETYSCDFQVGSPSKVTFYLEMSDLQGFDNPPSANFQIVLIW